MGEDQENRLKRVFGVMSIAQELAAHAQYHGSVPGHKRCERGLGDAIARRHEPFQELPIGVSGNRAAVEERLELLRLWIPPPDLPCSHTQLGVNLVLTQSTVVPWDIVSQIEPERCNGRP